MTGVAEARAMIRARGRGARRRGWSDRYLALMATLMAAAMATVPVRHVVRGLSMASVTADPARIGASLALLVLVLGLLVLTSQMVGPIVVSPADAAWLVQSPLDRRGVLARSASLLALASVVVGAALGVAGLAELGAPDHVVLRLGAAAVLGAALAVTGTATAVLAQPSEVVSAWLRGTGTSIVILAGLIAVVIVAWSAFPGRGLLAGLPWTPVGPLMAAAAVAAGIAAATAWWAWRSLAVFPARAVLGASVRLGTAAGATIGLEPALLTRMAEDTYWRARRLRSRRWPRLSAPAALAWQEWRMLGRRPARLGLALASTGVPALTAVAVGGQRSVVVVVVLAVALLTAGLGTTGVRRDADSPALRRLLGVDGRSVLAARTVLPAVLAATWCALALELLVVVGALPVGPWWLLGLGAAPALAVAALRMAERGPIDHTSIPVSIGIAWIPSGWLIWGFRGLDVAVPGCAALLVALAAPSAHLGTLILAQALIGSVVSGAYLANRARRPGRVL